MGLIDVFKTEYVKYTVIAHYKCLNCGEIIDDAPRDVQVEQKKIENLNNEITQILLYPKNDSLGFKIHHGHTSNSTYFHVTPHNCDDGNVGICQFSSFRIIKKNGENV